MNNWKTQFEKGRSWLESDEKDTPPVSSADHIEGPTLGREEVGDLLGPALLANSSDAITSALHACDSPIEEAMLTGLIAVGLYSADAVQVQVGRLNGYFGGPIDVAPTAVFIQPQARIGRYRIDFMVTVRNRWGMGDDFRDGTVLLECDGHDYHERTKEQAKRDKKRDRELQSLNFEIHHYTGSEIWENPVKCAADVLRRAEELTTEPRPQPPPG